MIRKTVAPRQREILRLMAEGLVKKEIVQVLNISVTKVSTRMQRLYETLHVKTNTGLWPRRCARS